MSDDYRVTLTQKQLCILSSELSGEKTLQPQYHHLTLKVSQEGLTTFPPALQVKPLANPGKPSHFPASAFTSVTWQKGEEAITAIRHPDGTWQVSYAGPGNWGWPLADALVMAHPMLKPAHAVVLCIQRAYFLGAPEPSEQQREHQEERLRTLLVGYANSRRPEKAWKNLLQ